MLVLPFYPFWLVAFFNLTTLSVLFFYLTLVLGRIYACFDVCCSCMGGACG
jgi:hypothetical protein